MKSLILSACFALLFLITLVHPLHSQVYLEEEGMLLQLDPKTKELLMTFEDSEITDRGYEYTLKVRLSQAAVAQMFGALYDGEKLVSMSEEEMELRFGPFLDRMTPAMKAAERKCEISKCGEVTLRPIFGKGKSAWLISRNSLKPGQKSDRGLTVTVYLEDLPPAKKIAAPIKKVVA